MSIQGLPKIRRIPEKLPFAGVDSRMEYCGMVGTE